MPHTPENPTLANRHYVTLILRLTLDQAGRLIQGDLADTAGSCQEHFFGSAGLHQAVESWLRRQQQTEGNQEP